MTRRLLVGLAALAAAVVIIVVVTAESEPASVGTAPPSVTVSTSASDGVPPLDEDAWSATAGTWIIDGTGARVAVADSDAPTFFVTDADRATSTVRARLDIPASSVGLVFRYEDPSSYWALAGIPSSGLWEVFKVVEGTRVEVGVFDDPICCSPGVLMSASTTKAGRVVVSVDSLLLLEVDDADLADNRRAGLFAAGGDATDAHFSGVELIERVPEP